MTSGKTKTVYFYRDMLTKSHDDKMIALERLQWCVRYLSRLLTDNYWPMASPLACGFGTDVCPFAILCMEGLTGATAFKYERKSHVFAELGIGELE